MLGEVWGSVLGYGKGEVRYGGKCAGVWGSVGGGVRKCVGYGKSKVRCGERCGEVCWGMGKVR